MTTARARGGVRAAARLLAALVVGAWTADARAGGGPAIDAYDDLAVGALAARGLADVYVLHDFNLPPSSRTSLREFDLVSDAPSLGYLRLTVGHRPAPIGFRLDVGVGDTADVYRLEDPALALHPSWARALSYVEQGFVTVLVPLGRGVAVDVGKFATPAGFEDNESIDNWSYSRSFLYSWAEPSLHTGVRLSTEVARGVAVALFWLDGWNANFVDGDDLRSFAAAISAHPRASVELIATYVAGLERRPTALFDPTLRWRDLLSVSGEWEATAWLALALAFDYGDDRAGGGVRFGGIAGYARVAPRRWLAATVRGEWLADPSGFVTGTAQTLGEVTATVDVTRRSGAVGLWARLEYRHDQSSARPFAATRGPASSQDTLTLALAATFESVPPRAR